MGGWSWYVYCWYVYCGVIYTWELSPFIAWCFQPKQLLHAYCQWTNGSCMHAAHTQLIGRLLLDDINGVDVLLQRHLNLVIMRYNYCMWHLGTRMNIIKGHDGYQFSLVFISIKRFQNGRWLRRIIFSILLSVFSILQTLTYWTRYGLMTPIDDMDLGQYRLRQWLVAWGHQFVTWHNYNFLLARLCCIHKEFHSGSPNYYFVHCAWKLYFSTHCHISPEPISCACHQPPIFIHIF